MLETYIHHAPEAIAVPVIVGVIGYWKQLPWLVVIAIGLLVGLFFFYRGGSPGPALSLPSDSILSPCQAKVLHIRTIGDYVHIAMFLNVHNIHVQYVPIDGTIVSVLHKPGSFHPAYLFEKSSLNERVETVIRTRIGDVKVVQIAGLVARRIVSFVRPHQKVQRGEPLGLIKFGSRVDVWIPKRAVRVVMVKQDQMVEIGQKLCKIADTDE